MSPLQSGEGSGLPSRVGNYRIQECLGAGGMGMVYRAWDEALRRPLAIKRLPPGGSDIARRRFRREARAAARLNHPAIVHIYEIIESSEGDWIVMELVEGETLSDLLDAGDFGLLQTLRLGEEIAEGLAEAHSQGVIHRDLKANNVMVSKTGRAKILDFGVAKLPAEQEDMDLSQTGVAIGTCYAMSPEQAMGLPVDARSDLFSLGSLLYEMLTGTSPFRGEGLKETLSRICSYYPAPARRLRRDVPEEVSDLIDQLLAKDPRHRPAGAAEVAEALKASAERASSGAAPSRLSVPSGDSVSLGKPIGSTHVERPVRGRPRHATAASSSSASSSRSRRAIRERRQVTLVLCELTGVAAAGGLAVARPLDLEVVHEVLPEVRAAAAKTAERFGGMVGDSMGHRLVLYLGYPQAYEDAAERAVRAALELAARVENLSSSSGTGAEVRLSLRAAVHTGTAIVLPESGQPTLGIMLDVAGGILARTAPGEVLASTATQRLLKEAFATDELSPVEIPGTGETTAVYRIVQAGTVEERRATAPLIGREREMELLLGLWREAAEGTGKVVLIGGEAGMGKSHLVRAFRERVKSEAQWLFCYGSPYASSSPLQPVVDLLRRMLDARNEDSPLDRLEAMLRPYGLPLAESVPFFALLLGLPLDDRHPAPALPPNRLRERTLESIAELALAKAERQPMIWAFEDLHWLDPSTLNLLDLLLDQAVAAPLLLVLTVRQDTMAAVWGPRAHLTHLSLTPMSEQEAAKLIDRVAGRPLSAAVRRQIVARTDGVPLFVEELTRTVLEAGPEGSTGEIPTTLRDSLAARLDHLDTAKEIAQLAAVLGRSFTFELLAAVSSLDEATLQGELKRLVQADLLQRRGFGSRTHYLFKHALIRDAAYDSLLRKERQEVHRRIAEALESRFPEMAESQPEIVAQHYAEAGTPGPAIAWYQRAGQKALARFANLEAIQQLEKGLALLDALPPGPQRDRCELGLLTLLGAALLVTRGFGAPEVKSTYTRAYELTLQLQDASEPQVLWGLFTYQSVQGNCLLALSLGEQILRAAERDCDPLYLVAGHGAVGVSLFCQGETEAARMHFEYALTAEPLTTAAYLPLGHRMDLVMIEIGAFALWLLGHPDQALERCREMVLQARDSSHPYSLSAALLLTSYVHFFCHDPETVRRQAEEMLAITEEHGLYMTREGNMLLGWAQAAAGSTEGIVLLREQLALSRALGFRVWETLFGCMLVQACLDHGLLAEAETALDGAFAAPQERFLDAELHRLRGEAALGRGDLATAAREIETAIEQARARSQRSLELRAAMSLARLRQRQGLDGGARALLADLYAGFAEGFGTADLEAAAALLSDLARHST
ncbi:MAG TPA: protein kinase [Thermoanaerobaculia bacterium]|nr:protein kinase [Thermoanaerobaculia bacterium]